MSSACQAFLCSNQPYQHTRSAYQHISISASRTLHESRILVCICRICRICHTCRICSIYPAVELETRSHSNGGEPRLAPCRDHVRRTLSRRLALKNEAFPNHRGLFMLLISAVDWVVLRAVSSDREQMYVGGRGGM